MAINSGRKILATLAVPALLFVGYGNRNNATGLTDLSRQDLRPRPIVETRPQRADYTDDLILKVIGLNNINRTISFHGIDIENLELPDNIADELIRNIEANRIDRRKIEDLLVSYANTLIEINGADAANYERLGELYNNVRNIQQVLIIESAMANVEG